MNFVRTLALLCSFAILVGCMRGDAPQKLEEKIVKRLPVGTPRSEAMQVLKEEGFEHSWVEREHALYGIRRNVTGTNKLVRQNLSIVVHFDQNNLVQAVKANPTFTGP